MMNLSFVWQWMMIGCAFAVMNGNLRAEEASWPRLYGPTGMAAVDEADVPMTWSDSENLVWKVALPGPGSSSPIVLGDKIFVTCCSGYVD